MFVRPISTQTAITFYLQLRIDFRLFLLVPYSKAYLYTILNLHINSWSHGCTSFYSRNPESTYSRILFRFLTHLDFVVCFRSKNESCRSRQNLSIPTNLTSFHPPQPENFVSQYFRSYGVNPRCTRARFFKSKFLWWEGRNNDSPQLSCSEFFNLTYGFVSLTQIYFLSILSQNRVNLFF